MKDIKETRELIRAVAAVGIRAVGDLSDGKISYMEMVGFLADIGVIREGVMGLASIPGELADLDDTEKETLLADIGTALVGAGLSHRVGDAAEKLLRWAYGTVRTILDIRSAPPTATPA